MMRRLARFFARFLVFLVILSVIGAIVGAVLYRKYVVNEPGEQIARENIQAIIAQESPVLYRDGKRRVGVLFAAEHREYVEFARIPRAWVDAIVASEDARFFSHPGIDPKGITRAMWHNLLAGRVVEGGSTLTQQTAKNLFSRPDRSWQSKVQEALGALRLEAHYSKDEILEFYANQFHVSGNGRGLGIAARYFFDKEVEELDALECAYLAGMVQAPARFNPFTGDTVAARSLAKARAKERTAYVLGRMLETGVIDQVRHDELAQRDIPFNKGTFRYDTSVLVDEVAERLEQAPFPELFAQLGIDNPSTAGVQIVTTLDWDAQREATYALWHHLTEVGMLLEKTSAQDLLLPATAAPEVAPESAATAHTFSAARVRSNVDGVLDLDLGNVYCRADAEALKRMATLLARSAKGESWREATKDEVEALITALPPGSVVWVSVRTPGTCDLERRPALQGGSVLLDRGQLRAMVGGNDNRNFNRVTHAQRQLGSTWKTLIYSAALQLGWTPTDALDNRPHAFPFEGSWYYPRADHQGQPFVSLSFAGARSENLASVWLLYHLTDRLTAEQLREVAALVDLAPRPGEASEAYRLRIRDDHGVVSTQDRLDELAFYGARYDVLQRDLDHPEDAIELRSLLYGRGFDDELAKIKRDSGGDERKRRLAALGASFLALEARGEACARELESWSGGAGVAGDLRLLPTEGGSSLHCGAPPEGALAIAEALVIGTPLPSDPEQIRVDGRLHLGKLRAVRRAMDRVQLVLANADPYSLDVLVLHPDFRALLNMRYVAGLARRLGVREEIPSVLSLPLGAVDISLEEAALLYQGISDGQVWTFPGTLTRPSAVPGLRSSERVAGPASQTQLIARILDRDGNVLYRADPVPEPVADPTSGRLVGDVLRNVVRHGTGRRALGAVLLRGAPVPLAGKTGTTNGYKNAAFAGFIPAVSDGAWTWGSGYTAAVYVGYDDNRPMTRGGTRLQGASGALPAWLGLARGLAEANLLGADAPGSAEIQVEEGYASVFVDELSGLPGVTPTETSPSVLVRGAADAPERGFAPWAPVDRAPARAQAAASGPTELPEAGAPPVEAAPLEDAPTEDAPIEVAPIEAAPREDPPEGAPVAPGEPYDPFEAPEPEPAAPGDSGIVPRLAPPDDPAG